MGPRAAYHLTFLGTVLDCQMVLRLGFVRAHVDIVVFVLRYALRS